MSILLILLALAALRYLQLPLLAMPVLLVCVYAGLTLPDIDQPLPLDHRSALTHSLLPALAIAVPPWARPAAAGLALGLGLHLAADMFPNAMTGYATIAIPFADRLAASGSYAWLVANAAACGLAGAWGLDRAVSHPGLQAATSIGVVLIGLWYLPRVDGGLLALLALVALGWLASRLSRRSGTTVPARTIGR